jgi:hypothetical protein
MSTKFSGLRIEPLMVAADETARTLTRGQSGKTIVIADMDADITFTLPEVEDGLNYEFVYSGTAADAQDWIVNTAATDELFYGGLVNLDVGGTPEVVIVDADQSNDDTMTILKVVSDGTHWYVSGFVASASAPTFA